MRPSTPALRFLAARGRVSRSRPLVVAGGLLARARLIHGFALWPDVASPVVLMNPADSAAARWMPGGFPEVRGTARLLGPGTWHALRARGLLVTARGAPPPVTAAERATLLVEAYREMARRKAYRLTAKDETDDLGE